MTWGLRAGVVVGGWVDLVAVHMAGGATPGWLWVVVTCAAAGAALWPDSLVVLLLLGGLLAAWLGVDAGALSGWVLLGAAGVVVTHVTATLLSQGPRSARVPPPLVRRWTRRAVALWAGAAVLWAVALLLRTPEGGTATSLMISALLVLAVGALWLGGALSTSRARP
jgi:hypothetical protein